MSLVEPSPFPSKRFKNWCICQDKIDTKDASWRMIRDNLQIYPYQHCINLYFANIRTEKFQNVTHLSLWFILCKFLQFFNPCIRRRAEKSFISEKMLVGCTVPAAVGWVAVGQMDPTRPGGTKPVDSWTRGVTQLTHHESALVILETKVNLTRYNGLC